MPDPALTLRLVAKFDVPGQPVPKARARVVKGRAYTPQTTVDYEADIGWACRAVYQGPPLDGPVELIVRVAAADGDLDNYVKTVSDALNKIMWHDDRQVERLQASIDRAAPPGLRVIVLAL